MNNKLIDYARAISIAASQKTLDADHALMFCRDAVPLLLAEIEVSDMLTKRFDALLRAGESVAPQPQPPAPVSVKKPARRKKKARAK